MHPVRLPGLTQGEQKPPALRSNVAPQRQDQQTSEAVAQVGQRMIGPETNDSWLKRCGTLLWDSGSYFVDRYNTHALEPKDPQKARETRVNSLMKADLIRNDCEGIAKAYKQESCRGVDDDRTLILKRAALAKEITSRQKQS